MSACRLLGNLANSFGWLTIAVATFSARSPAACVGVAEIRMKADSHFTASPFAFGAADDVPEVCVTDRLIVAGIFGLIATHIVVNIGAMTGIFPLTGVTLPFLSFG
ncbi:MAG: FtsW/RodA/SpoVE family cell cycle protein, partial [Acidobacteria bacterium]|nr:FtsW/RodA/SpoVE family cell cycle protein [Acidobacteriota bacterium]